MEDFILSIALIGFGYMCMVKKWWMAWGTVAVLLILVGYVHEGVTFLLADIFIYTFFHNKQNLD